jgi:hypothetical protein
LVGFVARSALYTEFVGRERVVSCWQRHLNGRDYSEFLGRVPTLEVWLQQVFEKKLRSA